MAYIPLPERIGEIQNRDGYFSRALHYRMETESIVERRVGYRAGRLKEGWWLMFLLDLPTKRQFEYRGYSQMSDGIPQGHLPENSKKPNAEQSLAAGGYNLYGNNYQKVGMKQATILRDFSLTGSRRLAKVLPVARAQGDPNIPDYPPGAGIPQWTLTAPLKWVAAAFIAPGKMYVGNYT